MCRGKRCQMHDTTANVHPRAPREHGGRQQPVHTSTHAGPCRHGGYGIMTIAMTFPTCLTPSPLVGVQVPYVYHQQYHQQVLVNIRNNQYVH